ncbi:hypothetical protein Vi05172_g7885 [Venturia inaequalis]|uniref:NAD(P)-binding protein n=1 Tax=Venturia inaequalis TaxID=5025 RepID=A0A8H3ZBT6_VENIN|nr:hypothetical protein EG327_001336 [Venturia inaequalis]RDI82100.1 hypothetical protein Vi05172_g7885 [Venturia inaequalis]
MPRRTLKVGIAGLGRMGKRHALHFLNRIPRATLVCAFSPDAAEIAWAREHLEPEDVTLYGDYGEMLGHAGLEAVVIVTVTRVHAEMSVGAVERGLHVLCEKPLSTDVEMSKTVLAAASAHPKQKVLCGFSRRFDTSYRTAYSKISRGDIGTPTIIRSQTCDKLDPSGFFVNYAAASGGIFVDCNIHDIDLAIWFLSAGENDNEDEIKLKVKSCYAVGVCAVQPGLAEHGDVDNGIGIVEFHGGKIAHFYSSRMMAAGQHDETEIIGTAGKISVNARPARDLLEMHEADGVRREIVQDYYGRFEEAFVREGVEFTEACLEGTALPFGLGSAVLALEIGTALQESLRTGRKIEFGVDGRRLSGS